MTSINVKQEKDLAFSSYQLAPPASNEIDLLNLLDVLWRGKNRIIAITLAFALVGLLAAFFLPQKWTSQAIVTTAEPVQWQALEQKLVALRVLEMDVQVTPQEVFTLFIKKFNSTSLLEDYLRSSPYVMSQLKGADVSPEKLHQAIVILSEKMQAVDDNAKNKDGALFTSWTLSFSAPDSGEAQKVLTGYIDYVSNQVEKQVLTTIRNQLEVKTRFEQAKLAQDRIRLKNQLDANIERLNYSLEIADAAGIKKPVYSNGQAVKDDPDFSISLGADGIAKKLEIQKSVTDPAQINGELHNREYYVKQLAEMNVSDVQFSPFKYQMSPSLPIKKDGVGKGVIMILAALIGAMLACGGVLLRNAMLVRKMEKDLYIGQQLV